MEDDHVRLKVKGKYSWWNLIRKFELHHSEKLSYISLERSFESKSRQCRTGQCQNIYRDSNCSWMKIAMNCTGVRLLAGFLTV